MKRSITHRLFWKKWPYKVLLRAPSDRPRYSSHLMNPVPFTDFAEDALSRSKFRQWFKKHHPDCGIRCETGISVFLSTRDELEHVIDTWKKYVKEVWEPADQESLTAMKDHVYDVVRDSYWYKRFPVRARILYTPEFRLNGLSLIRDALSSIPSENWLARGLLEDLLAEPSGRVPWACGQPVYLYLLENEDAIMLKLQAGDWIDRFERIRKPQL